MNQLESIRFQIEYTTAIECWQTNVTSTVPDFQLLLPCVRTAHITLSRPNFLELFRYQSWDPFDSKNEETEKWSRQLQADLLVLANITDFYLFHSTYSLLRKISEHLGRHIFESLRVIYGLLIADVIFNV